MKERATVSEKPANIVEKMVAGRLKKFVKQVTLLDQPFVMDDSQSVKDFVASHDGGSFAVSYFARFKVGEGIEKAGKSFAEEVAELQ